MNSILFSMLLNTLLYALGGCLNMEEQPIDEPKSDEIPTLTFKLDDPASFVEEHFGAQFLEDPTDAELKVKAMEKEMYIKLIRNKEEVKLRSRAVIVSRIDGKCKIGIDSSAMSLEDTMKVAAEMCDLIGRDTAKLREWHTKKKYEEAGADCLLMQSVDGNSHAVNLRTSFDEVHPWRVFYSVRFDIRSNEKREKK